jgi:hypothetical protein
MEVLMKKIFIILFLLFFLFLCFDFVYSKITATFPDLNNPYTLKIYGERLFISDGPVIYIYDSGDYRLLNKFGNKGEGPGEFKVHPNINRGSLVFNIKDDQIMVSSLGRVSFFTINGKYLEEKVPQALFGFGQFQTVENHYIGLGAKGHAMKQFITINFYDSDFKKGNEIFKVLAFEQGKKINPITIGIIPTLFATSERIFCLDYEGYIHIFGSQGEKLSVIRISQVEKNYSRVKVSQERKRKYIEFFKSDPRFKQQFEQDINTIRFPDYFPEIRDFKVADRKIYAISFREKNQQKEIFIFELNGKLLKKMMIPLGELSPRELTPYTIEKGNLYQLVENLNTEEWELDVISLD